MPAATRAVHAGPRACPRPNKFLALTTSAAVALGLALGLGPAASAAAIATAQTYYVAPNGTDPAGSCTANTVTNAFPTIQDALACAVSGDAISLAPTGSTPYPGIGAVGQNVTISAQSGATPRTVTVDESTAALTVNAGATVSITGVTLTGGTNAGAPDVTNNGILTLTQDTVTGNEANGGILNTPAAAKAAKLTVKDTTVSGNQSTGPGGGITSAPGPGTGKASLKVENSTVADNTGVNSQAGGIAIGAGTTATLINATITANTGAGGTTGGLLTAASAGAVVLSNTIIGGNTTSSGTAPDCAGALADGPGGHNLIGNIGTGCTGLTNGVNGDLVSVPAGLLPLADNDGPTNTAALAAASPAIGAGNATTCAQPPITGADQRGHHRKAGTRGVCDIGAYDTAGKPTIKHTYFVAPGGTDTKGKCGANTASNAFPTIGAGLACAVDGDAISLAPTGSTPYAGFGEVTHSVAIAARSGANARTVTVDESSTALTVDAGNAVSLTGVTLTGGSNASAPDVTNNGVLTLNHDTIAGSLAGGGITNETTGGTAAELVLNSSTVSGNQGTGPGGGITSAPGTGTGPVSLTAENSTIADNTGVSSVAGGIAIGTGTTATFINATITGNTGDGGAAGGLATDASTGAVVLSNTIIGGNTASSGTNPDCVGALADGPGGDNLIGDTGTSCTGLTNGVNGDQLNVDPGLEPLANNGGSTNTAALAATSPAISAANPTVCEQAPINDKDQRNQSRSAPSRGACDIGAYDTGGAPVGGNPPMAERPLDPGVQPKKTSASA